MLQQHSSPQQPSPQHRPPSKAPKRFFGWLTLIAFVLTLLLTGQGVHDIFALITFFSCILWLAAFMSYRQALAPQTPAVPVQRKRKITTEDVYLEAAQLRQAAQQSASQEALSKVQNVPDEVDGLMLLGAAIDPERHPQKSVLLQRVVNRERWMRAALAFFALTGGGR